MSVKHLQTEGLEEDFNQ